MADPAPPPSCPSPSSSFPAFLTHLTTTLDALTSSASALPPKSDLAFHRTLDRKFGRELDAAGSEVLALTERLLGLVDLNDAGGAAAKGGKGKGKEKRRRMTEEEDVVDGYRRGVVDAVDGLLEDADSCLDELKGERKKAAIDIQESFLAAAGDKLPGPFSDPYASRPSSAASSSKRPLLPPSLMHASHLPKPQLVFPDPPDNSPSRPPFRPSLADKPHSLVPLSYEPPLDYEMTEAEHMSPSKAYARREREQRLRLHPYFYETRHLPYPTSMFCYAEPIPPRSFEETPFEFVDTPEKLEAVVEKLKIAKEIAVDLEHHSLRSYYGFTCLLQISTREGDWVVDALKLRGELREGKLGGVLADPAIVKVFHGAESDVVWLQKDFDIYMVNLFDTYHATKVLDHPAHSLASLLSLYCSFPADKRYQQADWRLRPLTPEMMHYARADTHFLLFIYDNLRNALLEMSRAPSPSDPHSPSPVSGKGMEVDEEKAERERRWRSNPQKAMRAVLERSEETALKIYVREGYDAEGGKGNLGWAGQARRWLPRGGIDEEMGWIWRRVHVWRDGVAREEDESPFYIMSNETLKNVSLRPPSTVQALKTLISRSEIASSRAAALFDVIENAKREWKEIQAEREKEIKRKEAEAARKLQEEAERKKAREKESQPPTSWTDGVWNHVENGWDDSDSKDRGRKAESGLFGGALGRNAAPKANGQGGKGRKGKSGLFGATIQRDREETASGGFDAVRKSIFEDMRVKRAGPAMSGVEDPPRAEEQPRVEPETVPFVRKEERATILTQSVSHSEVEAAPSPEVPAPAPKVNEEGAVVNVKRKKEKKRGVSKVSPPTAEPEGISSGIAPPSPEEGGDATVAAPAQKKRRHKNKVKMEDVPVFDYAGEKSLLDDPHGHSRAETGRKGKKEKRKEKKASSAPTAPAMIETPRFGARPVDRSQPKAGNRSGTFGK